ncbi:MAG: hypothetical protein R3B09_09655 [Nannocystaceae bacterium]
MTKQTSQSQDPSADENEGEGSRTAARHYDQKTRAFVDAGKVDAAARAAERALDGDEAEALEEAEEIGKSKARG